MQKTVAHTTVFLLIDPTRREKGEAKIRLMFWGQSFRQISPKMWAGNSVMNLPNRTWYGIQTWKWPALFNCLGNQNLERCLLKTLKNLLYPMDLYRFLSQNVWFEVERSHYEPPIDLPHLRFIGRLYTASFDAFPVPGHFARCVLSILCQSNVI